MNDVAFKPAAYRKVAEVLEGLDRDIETVYKKDGLSGLEQIPGVGKGIAYKIEEYLKKGKIKEYQDLKKKTPVDLEVLSAVEGLGPKKIKALYENLKVKNLVDLEKVAKAGKIGTLPNFGIKSEQNILQGIEFLKKGKGRLLLGSAWSFVEKIKNRLKKLKGVKNVSEAGSTRRRKETIGDIDILVAVDNPKDAKGVADFFASMPEVEKVIGKGDTKVSVQTKMGFDMDLRLISLESWGSALQYFTGSKEHNITTRKIAISKGFKLNEYGVFKGKEKIAGETEEGVYEKLGMEWVAPEMRENSGEIELALISTKSDRQAPKNKFPKVIELKDIKGDLHCHSHWNINHGLQIKELIEKAVSLGYQYLGISDHTKFLAIEHGLNEKELLVQNEFIKTLNSHYTLNAIPFTLLHGCEANIMADGSIDISDDVLSKLNYVIAGVHSRMKMNKKDMTERIIKAMRNPNIDIIAHITGRIIGRRDEYEIDFDEILQIAKETGTILEINANPSRLDLKDTNIRKAKEANVRMIISTDAHQSDQMDFMKYGVSQARRGWAEKGDIVNTWETKKLLSLFKK